MSFSPAVNSNPPLLLWRGFGLLPKDSKTLVQLNLDGEYKGCAIKFMHAKTYDIYDSASFLGSSEKLLFDGCLILIDIPKPFSEKTIIRRDQGNGQPKIIRGLNKVGLVDPVFERTFEVYGSDQVESRALLTPDFMQEILELERSMQDMALELGFVAGHLLIKFSKPMKDIRKVLDAKTYDITLAQNLIDKFSHIFNTIDVMTKSKTAVSNKVNV